MNISLKETLEGIITYLNAFLILDWTRSIFKDRPGLAVAIMIVVTIIVFAITYRLRSRNSANSSDDSMVARLIPPDPQMLAETFQVHRSRMT